MGFEYSRFGDKAVGVEFNRRVQAVHLGETTEGVGQVGGGRATACSRNHPAPFFGQLHNRIVHQRIVNQIGVNIGIHLIFGGFPILLIPLLRHMLHELFKLSGYESPVEAVLLLLRLVWKDSGDLNISRKDTVVLSIILEGKTNISIVHSLLDLVRRNGLPHTTPHGLRHSFATVANSQGVPMFDISRTLGHSSMTVTSNIYTHLFDDTEAQALAAVAKAIEKA